MQESKLKKPITRYFTPGPVQMYEKYAPNYQAPYTRTEQYSQLTNETSKNIRKIFGLNQEYSVLFMSGSGTIGVQSLVTNFGGNGNKNKIYGGGTFSKRIKSIFDTLNEESEYIDISKNFKVEEHVGSGACNFFITYHETSIGSKTNFEKLTENKRPDDLILVDAISAAFVDQIDMVREKIDALVFSSNKALALMPGLVVVILSPDAKRRIAPLSFYENYELFLKDEARGQSPWTLPSHLMSCLNTRVKDLLRLQIDEEYKKRKLFAEYFRKRIKEIGLQYNEVNPSNAITNVYVKNARRIVEKLKLRGLIVAPSPHPRDDEEFRVGHMGNLNDTDFEILVQSIEEIMKDE